MSHRLRQDPNLGFVKDLCYYLVIMREKLKFWKHSILYSKQGLRTGWRILAFASEAGIYCVLSFLGGAFALILLVAHLLQRPPSPQEAFLGFILLQGSFALPTIYVARHTMQRFERRPFASIGLKIDWRCFKEFAAGLALGAILVGINYLYLYLTGKIQLAWAPVGWTEVLGIFSAGVVGWLGVALWEELYFRGYLLQTLIQGIGVYGAVLLTSTFFGLLHITTYGMTPLILTDITVFGLLMAFLYLKTKSLWGPIGLHFANNFLLAHVLPIPVEDIALEFLSNKIKINDQPVQFEVPRLFFQVEMAGSHSLISWEVLIISLMSYVIVTLIILKLPWFRPHPQMEALWQQYIHPAQPWARLQAWFANRPKA